MSTIIIEQFPKEKRIPADDSTVLLIAECFGNTLQGENFIGFPATFLRLKNCTIKCHWCDTIEVWKLGNPYSIKEVLDLFEQNGLIDKFRDGQRLVLTGGSPLLQQNQLVSLIKLFIERYNFLPYIEVENETILKAIPEFVELVSCWNNSPKTANSGMKKNIRYKPETIKQAASFKNSWFKFVLDSEDDWKEIQEDFLDTGLINKNQIILMPQGQTQLELEKTTVATAELAIKYNVRFSPRLHIDLWDKKVGV